MTTFKINVIRTVDQMAELTIEADSVLKAIEEARRLYEEHQLMWTIEGEDRDVTYEVVS